MGEGLRLEGKMIPRRVKRMFDERGEPRAANPVTARLEWRGASLAIRVANVSPSGAMVVCDEVPHIGEAVTLALPGHAPAAAVVRWVRDGRIGLHFDAPVG